MHSAVEEQGSVLGILRLLWLVSGGNDAKWTGSQGMWKGASSCVMTSECGWGSGTGCMQASRQRVDGATMEFGSSELYLGEERYLGRTGTWCRANSCVYLGRRGILKVRNSWGRGGPSVHSSMSTEGTRSDPAGVGCSVNQQ